MKLFIKVTAIVLLIIATNADAKQSLRTKNTKKYDSFGTFGSLDDSNTVTWNANDNTYNYGNSMSEFDKKDHVTYNINGRPTKVRFAKEKNMWDLGNDPNQIHYDGGTGKLTYGNGFSVSKNELHSKLKLKVIDKNRGHGRGQGRNVKEPNYIKQPDNHVETEKDGCHNIESVTERKYSATKEKKKKMKDNLKTFKEKLEEWRKKDQGPKEQAYEVFEPEKNRFSLLGTAKNVAHALFNVHHYAGFGDPFSPMKKKKQKHLPRVASIYRECDEPEDPNQVVTTFRLPYPMDENDYYPVRGPIVKIHRGKIQRVWYRCVPGKDLCEDCKPGYTCAIKTTLSSKLIKYNAPKGAYKARTNRDCGANSFCTYNGNNLDDLLDETYAEDVLQE